MRNIGKMLIAICIVLFVLADAASACTGVYVGPAASADGTAFIARSSDNQAVWGNHITITPRVENKPGRTMQVDMNGKVFANIPATTYKYTATPFFSSVMNGAGVPNDATACTNEYGVSMTMAITAFANSAALKADPLKAAGLTENTAADLVLCQSQSAREAAKVLASIIDQYGSSECNIALIADQKEVWYMEMYTGYQYAAVKLPADKVSVFGNEFTLEYLSDYKESFTSKNLEKLPEKHGFAVHGKNKELNLFKTYSGKEVAEDYCHMRTWIGHKMLAPSLYKDGYKLDAMYPLCFKPDKKVSLQDVCAILRNRYEGTEYNPDATGRIDMRVIGTDTAMSVHVLQVYPDMPADMACVTWESTGPAIYGVFVPVSNASLSVNEAYGRDQPASEFGRFDAEHYPYYAFKELSTLCVGHDSYEAYGIPVKEYWGRAEKNMAAGMPKVLKKASKMKDSKAAADYITNYCSRMQTQAFEDAKHILNSLIWRQASDSNTMKLGRNPETGELLKTPRMLKPLEIDLDASVYALKP
ncbi:MAG: C69 family dipeptidase [Spirochaetia bacterium]|nr:C69 family dipeptidase [Spirochaetia bacterium]